ncbi:MAG: serine/threonine-protein kinase, partial [Candidatus Brocadiaceae bacterium]
MEERAFGKFTLLEHVGKGGMGSVYRARDNKTKRVVAVKTFQSGEEREPELSRTLRDREVQMLLSVQHPNIVKYFESGHVEDDYYYTMEFVEESLLKLLRAEAELSLLDKVHILRQTAGALSAIHHQGIVHRDVKPGNILLDKDPNQALHVKLTDLGIAKNVREPDIVREQTHRRIPGTPRYLSPEQIRMEPLDGRSDVFGLGVLAYEMLAGKKPFQAEGKRDYLKANVEQQQGPLEELDGEVPPFLSRIVDRMLAKDREQRYDSEALARDLELAQQHIVSGAPLVERTNPASLFYEPPERREVDQEPSRRIAPVSWWLAAAVCVVGGLAVALFWPAPPEGPQGTGPRPDQPEDVLAEAESAVSAGRYWQALALLERSSSGAGDGEHPRRNELSFQAQNALAEGAGSSARTMLQEGRVEEAEIMLRRMEAFFPDSPHTLRLEDEIAGGETPPPDEGREGLLAVADLARQGRFEEALVAARKLLEQNRSDPGEAAAARQALHDVFDVWAGELTKGPADAAAIEAFFAALGEHGFGQEGGPDAERRARLHLRLAEQYRSRGEYERALAQYELTGRTGEPAIAREAEAAAGRLRARLRSLPLAAERFAEELAEQGLRSPLWRGTRGSELTRDGCRLAVAAGHGEPSELRTLRPVRNLGFTASVEFRVGEGVRS